MQPKDDGFRAPGPHTTEGELHTFLDGALDLLDAERASEVRAHLEGCRPCRDQLAVESALRDRAAALLGADDPLDALVLPSLDELRLRAGEGDRPEGVRRTGGMGGNRWAWAATVVLSLGVGYGVGVLGPEGVRPGAVPMPGAASAVNEDAALEAVEALPESPDAEGFADAASRDAAEMAAKVDSEGGAPVSTPVVAEAEPTPVEPALAPPMPVPSAGLSADAAGAVERSAADVPPPPSDASVNARLAEIPSDVTAATAVRIDSLPDVDAGQRARPLSVAPLPEPPAAAQSRRAVAPRLLDEITVVGPAAVDQRRSRASEAEEIEMADEVELVLPGLTLEEVRWTEVWPGQDGVVARQHLPDGVVVELRVAGAPVGGDPPTAEPPAVQLDAPPGWARAVRRVEGGWMALDGPLPVERLAALLALAR